jgi:hypothetical protein
MILLCIYAVFSEQFFKSSVPKCLYTFYINVMNFVTAWIYFLWFAEYRKFVCNVLII